MEVLGHQLPRASQKPLNPGCRRPPEQVHEGHEDLGLVRVHQQLVLRARPGAAAGQDHRATAAAAVLQLQQLLPLGRVHSGCEKPGGVGQAARGMRVCS